MNKKGYLNKLMLACLALLMSFSVLLKAYAADSVSLDEVKVILSSSFPSINFTDYYYKSVSSDSSYGIMLICQDIVDKYTDIVAYQHTYTDGSYEYRLGGFTGSDIVYINDNYAKGVRFNASGSSSGSLSNGSFLFSTKYPCDFITNIPLFDSLDSAYSYVIDGDTSGLLNADLLPKVYDPTIESPINLKISYDSAMLSNTEFIITWEQSSSIDLTDYTTEIYWQPRQKWSYTLNLFDREWHSFLPDKTKVASEKTDYNNKVSVNWKSTNDAVENYLNANNITGCIVEDDWDSGYSYFYIRNVTSSGYGNWIKVSYDSNNLQIENSLDSSGGGIISGYEEIKGDSSSGGSAGSSITGTKVEGSQYGKQYNLNFNDEDIDNIVKFIKNGFGLLGDNGLLSFIREVFSFLPDPVWTIIYCMIGVCAVFIIIKVVRN